MNIQDLFSAATGGLAGINVDLYAVMIAAIGCCLIICGCGVLAGFLTREKEMGEDHGDEFEEGFQEYARGRYTKELYRRTYESRGVGKSSDLKMPGDL
jgi:hypothetical protein